MEGKHNLKGNRYFKYELFLELIFFLMWLFLRCDPLKMELKWELVALEQQGALQWRAEASAQTCGSQLGMFLTHVAKGLSQKYSKMQHSGMRALWAGGGESGRAESSPLTQDSCFSHV